MASTNEKELIKAMANLLEWAKGNRGPKDINPYMVPEVKQALELLSDLVGEDDVKGTWKDYLVVDTKALAEGE
jgi:hypothetical protein